MPGMSEQQAEEQAKEQKPSEIVYHYTSMETLLKIVKTRFMRATSIKYLNDTREREGFLKEAVETMPALASDTSLDSEAFSDYLRHGLWSGDDLTELPFVTSFSEKEDSLPQWRSYCPNGNGVSIGFDVSCLKMAKVHGDASLIVNGKRHETPIPARFEKVNYYRPKDDAEIEKAVRDIYKEAYESPARFSQYQGQADIPLSQMFRLMLEDAAATYKEEAFAAEAEHRLIANGVYWQLRLMCFRANRSTLVPYVEIDIPNQAGSLAKDARWDALRRVVVGPTPNEELTISALNAFFHSNNMQVDVKGSNVPYRDW